MKSKISCKLKNIGNRNISKRSLRKINTVIKRVPNIDLRISKMPTNFLLNNNNIVKKTSSTRLKHKISKPSVNTIYNPAYKISNIRKMNWKQLKQKYPKLSPTADADFDGLVNAKDCKPFDPSKDGLFSRFIGKVTGDKYGQTAKEYEEEKEFKKEQILQKKEAIKASEIAEKKREIKKQEKEIAKHVAEKGYAPVEAERLKRERAEKFKEWKEKLRAKAEAIQELKPEKTIMGRLVTRSGIPTSKKAIRAKRIAGYRKIAKATERFAGVRGPAVRVAKTVKGKKLEGAGRPKGSYKYRDPRTGEPITAIQYHKLRKQLKKQAKVVETQTEVKQRFALAKRGLSPEEVAETQEEINERMARLRAIKEMKQQQVAAVPEEVADVQYEDEQVPQVEQQVVQQQVQQIPTQIIQQQVQPQYQRVGHQGVPPGYRLQEDLMTGRKTLVPLPQQEAWTR